MLPVRVTVNVIGFDAVSEPARSVEATDTDGNATASLSAIEPLALAGDPTG